MSELEVVAVAPIQTREACADCSNKTPGDAASASGGGEVPIVAVVIGALGGGVLLAVAGIMFYFKGPWSRNKTAKLGGAPGIEMEVPDLESVGKEDPMQNENPMHNENPMQKEKPGLKREEVVSEQPLPSNHLDEHMPRGCSLILLNFRTTRLPYADGIYMKKSRS